MILKRTVPPPPTRVYRRESNGIVRTIPAKKLPIEIKEKRINPFVRYWNSLPGLRTHQPDTKIYSQCIQMIRQLRNKGLGNYLWDNDWIKRSRINRRFLSEPWSEFAIYKTMDTLSQMTQPGFFPGPNSFLCKSSLVETIYNPRIQNSMFAYARSCMVPPVTKQITRETILTRLSPEDREFLQVLEEYSVEIPTNVLENVGKLYNTLCQNFSEPLIRHLYPTSGSFAEALGLWLSGRNLLKPGKALLPPDGWIWKQFFNSLGFEE